MLVRMTKQRDVLLDCLKGTKTHPTAEWVWLEAKKSLPEIGFATVYRNLHTLKDMGRIQSIDAGDGKEHFDYDTSPHAHTKCPICGKIDDLVLPTALQMQLAEVSQNPYQLVYNGACHRCNDKNNKQKGDF